MSLLLISSLKLASINLWARVIILGCVVPSLLNKDRSITHCEAADILSIVRIELNPESIELK